MQHQWPIGSFNPSPTLPRTLEATHQGGQALNRESDLTKPINHVVSSPTDDQVCPTMVSTLAGTGAQETKDHLHHGTGTKATSGHPATALPLADPHTGTMVVARDLPQADPTLEGTFPMEVDMEDTEDLAAAAVEAVVAVAAAEAVVDHRVAIPSDEHGQSSPTCQPSRPTRTPQTS